MFAARTLSCLVNACRKPRSGSTARKSFPQLMLESLDARLVPSTVSWTGQGGNLDWDTAANWSGGAVPGATDDVVISSATTGPITINDPNSVHSLTDSSASLTIANGSLDLTSTSSITGNLTIGNGTLVAGGSLSVGSLTQTNGILTGSGIVTVTGKTIWTGGLMSGSGQTIANGGLQIGAADGNTYNESIDGRTLVNAGTANWIGAGGIYADGEGTLLNRSGATLNVTGALDMSNNSSTGVGGIIFNQGTIVSAPGSGTVNLTAAIDNYGSLRVQSGTLNIVGNGVMGGSTSVAAGATLSFGINGYAYTTDAFGSVSSVSGAGTVDFGSGLAVQFLGGAAYNVTGKTIINTGDNSNAGVTFESGSKAQSVGALEIDSGVADFGTGSAITAASLLETGGVLDGTDSLTVTGKTTWTGGVMAGPATTTAAGGLVIGQAGDTQTQQTLEARTFVNRGTGSWIGGGGLNLSAGATFTNLAGAILTESVPETVWVGQVDSGSEPSRFVNQGSFVIAPGKGTAAMDAVFNNSGTVAVQNGTWQLVGTGQSTGTITAAAGAAVQLNEYYSGSVTGQGSVTSINGSNLKITQIMGGAVTISSGYYEVNGTVTVSSLNISGGVLSVHGTLIVTGSVVWTDGYIGGPGVIDAQGGVQLGTGTTPTTVTLDGATLVNYKMLALEPDTTISQNDGSTIQNLSGATFNVQGSASWASDGTDTFINQGTFEKSAGTNTATVQYVTLVNNGTVVSNAGTLDWEGGGTATGSLSAGAGDTLNFGHSYMTFTAGGRVGGAGVVSFGENYWSNIFLSSSALNVTGSTVVNGGGELAVNFLPGCSVSAGNLQIESGTAQFDTGSAVSAATLNESGGRLTGPDAMNVRGLTTWTNGTMAGTGTTNANGGLDLGANDGQQHIENLDARTLVNAAAGVLVGTGTIYQTSGGTFVNATGASFTLQDAMYWNGDAGSTFLNAGTLTKPVSTGTSTISAALVNSGTVSVGGGSTLAARGGYTQTAGTTALSGGTLTGSVDLLGGVLSGIGIVNGDLTNAATVDVGGATPGTLTVQGDYTQTASGVLGLTVNGTAAGQYDALGVTGTATLGGTLAVTHPANFAPAVGSILDILTFGSRSGTSSFATETGLTLSNGEYLTPTYSKNALTLLVG